MGVSLPPSDIGRFGVATPSTMPRCRQP